MTTNLIKRIEQNPKILFLIDGFGALTTALFLGIILVKFETFFGIPSSTLYLLATIPIFYMIYDVYCYKKDTLQLAAYLRGIAIMNLIYCILSLGLAINLAKTIRIWGWLYVIGEIIIIVTLSIIELKVAQKSVQS